MTDQLLKARTRYVGSRDNLAGIIETLASTLTRRGARSFRRAAIAAAEGDFTQGWTGVNIGVQELQGIYADAFRRAGVAESTILRGFEIDMTHPRVRAHLRRRAADLVVGIDNETRIALRRALAEGTVEGLRPEELAPRIRGIIGLSPRDAQAVDNLRAGMRAQGIPTGTANRRAREYADRLLDARSLIIARTEVIDAIETGRQELWEQAVEAGLLAREHIWRVWVTFEDERVCPICRPLDGARARLGGVFSKGGQTSPRPPAHPNCRCSVDYEIAQFRIRKHAGPGLHPGTGSPQSVHGGGGGSGGASGVPGLAEPAPFDPGTSTLPEGHVRLYHYTSQPGVIESIAAEGLKLETARGVEYGEPGLVWASTRMPDEAYKEFVEFSLPFDDLKWSGGRVEVGSFADGTKLTADIVNEGGVYDLGFRGDIDTSSFIAIYKPWHFHFRYIMGDSKTRADLRDPPWPNYWEGLMGDPSYGPAITLARQKLGITKHGGSSHDQKTHGNWARGGGQQYANEGFPKQVSESSPKDFYSGFSQGRRGLYGAFLSDFDQEHFEEDNVRTFTAFDGKVGAALTDHDDGRVEVGSLYALPGAPDGSGRDLLRYLIHEKGANWLNNFDGVLTEFYIAEGFRVQTTDPWSDQFAPPNWDYNRFGRPDYITMGNRTVTKHDTRGRSPGQEGLLGTDEETDGVEGRQRADALSGSSVGDGQGIRAYRPQSRPLDKHYGPGPHPGTGTPQKIHGLPKGGVAIESTGGFSTNAQTAMKPYMFTFATKTGADYTSVVTKADEVGQFGGIIQIEGEIQADDGERVGAFLRQVDLRSLSVFNASFKVDEQFQGEGIGLTWLTLVENGLHRAGIERMNVSAVDVGRYAWARYGYDWQTAGGNVGIQWWDNMMNRVDNSAVFATDFPSRGTAEGHREWDALVDRAREGDYPQPWEIASIPDIGSFVLLTGREWAGTKDTTIDYEAVAKVDSVAYNRLLHQWVKDGKAGLIESDDPSWFEAVAQLR